MIFRALTSAHDWEFGKGTGDYLKNDDAIGLNIETRLLSWLGDCFFDRSAGVDWLNRMGLKDQQELLTQECKLIIMQSFGVTKVVDFSMDFKTDRTINLSYNITTIFSPSYINSVAVGL